MHGTAELYTGIWELFFLDEIYFIQSFLWSMYPCQIAHPNFQHSLHLSSKTLIKSYSQPADWTGKIAATDWWGHLGAHCSFLLSAHVHSRRVWLAISACPTSVSLSTAVQLQILSQNNVHLIIILMKTQQHMCIVQLQAMHMVVLLLHLAKGNKETYF